MELNRRNMFRIALLITFGIAVFWVFENFSAAKATFFWVLSLFTPFLIGACIAFILNVPMRAIERHLWPNAKPPIAQKLRRPAAMALTLLCFFGVLSILVFLIVPELIRTASSISAQIPLFLTKIEELFNNINQKLPEITGQASSLNLNLEKTIESFFSMLGGSVSMLTTGLFRFVSLLFGGAAKAVFGIIFAFYLLAQKETLSGQFQRVLTAYNQEKLLGRLTHIGELTNRTFSNFLTGQCLEALILGSLFFVSMTLFRMPYALLISVLIAVTALIPIVGAFIGCIVGALLILVQNPIQAIWFVVWFLVLQQIEGNLIYPHVVGSSVGLPGLWVLFAVTVGGAVGGIIGMFVSVPICSVLYALGKEEVRRRLSLKKKAPPKPAVQEKE
ncbi:AI-2E family transporter [Phocea massiliensis]|uniref:AI-2E family transporter n=1 Tax=Merdimmobilis hominis TaxID=2897707 RepID=A0A939BEE6_9FIRM|nr:AI-2E family transporter [Merdimmobilis hominis]MBM6920892.1 AI-2E family transporter [Merdimmobilis hominis]